MYVDNINIPKALTCGGNSVIQSSLLGPSGSCCTYTYMYMYVYIQWNLSNLDAFGTKESVLISEVS